MNGSSGILVIVTLIPVPMGPSPHTMIRALVQAHDNPEFHKDAIAEAVAHAYNKPLPCCQKAVGTVIEQRRADEMLENSLNRFSAAYGRKQGEIWATWAWE